jgi:methionyl-tRNA synthetase
MSANERFYITTPIFYPNGVPHIGHAYTAIATDVLARFARHDGKDVFFLTGTDEHGQKMQRTAEKEGVAPIELADRNTAVFQRMVEVLGCSNDDFIRTTEERHKIAVQELWRRMETNGDIYLGKYGGWYSVRQEAYFDESETVVGEDGVRREPLGSEVEWVEEESYYFRLSAYGDRLLDLYETNPEFVAPAERRNEVASFVKGGLKDLSISRTTFDWGVPVPGNDAHVMYVWVDALTNYITAAGFPDENAERWPYWPAMHIIGKDIVRFHAVYWPAFLMSAGVELPKRVYAHGFLFNKGEKMSKSVGNVVDPFALVDAYGLDPVRYFFMREVPFGQDGSYSHEAIVSRINADLANGLGNLAQRSLSMIAKNCAGNAGFRRRPLYRRAGAVDLAQDRSRSHGGRSLHDGRNGAPYRADDTALHAGLLGKAARSRRRSGRQTRLRRDRRCARFRHVSAGTVRCFSALCRQGRRRLIDAGTACRQPLPPRFPGFRGRTRRHRAARPRSWDRAHGDHLDAGQAVRPHQGDRRRL